jgi:hypothetical protein
MRVLAREAKHIRLENSCVASLRNCKCCDKARNAAILGYTLGYLCHDFHHRPHLVIFALKQEMISDGMLGLQTPSLVARPVFA